MITRVIDPRVIADAVLLYPGDDEIRLDAPDWIRNPDNIGMVDDRGNVGMFGIFTPGVYTGHYFFKDRGKQARDVAVDMLSKMFETARVIRGLTPLDNRPAVWMTRHLGFKEVDVVDTWVGPCAVFIMTREEFRALYKDA